MQNVSFNEVKQNHFQKSCMALHDLAACVDPLSALNTALLDKDSARIKKLRGILEQGGCRYKLTDMAEFIPNKSRLRIVYLIPSTGITGGTRILIEQSNQLAARGHDVLLFSHCPKPDWIDCRTHFYLVHPNNQLSDVVASADIVIAGYWSLVVDALRIHAPVKYHFTQGDFDVFAYHAQEPYFQKAIATAYHLPLKLLTVSDVMKQNIRQLFGRKAVKIPNALSDKFLETADAVGRENFPPEILLVGSDIYEFKGHDTILDVLHYLAVIGYSFTVNWLTQHKLQKDYSRFGFTIRAYVSPPQEEVVNIYKKSDIFICSSFYEAFGLPSLEAMATGTAVITSDNGGSREYAQDGYNCLVFEPGNVFMLANKLQSLLDSPALRRKLKINGLSTAKKFTWKKSIHRLENEFTTARIIQATRY